MFFGKEHFVSCLLSHAHYADYNYMERMLENSPHLTPGRSPASCRGSVHPRGRWPCQLPAEGHLLARPWPLQHLPPRLHKICHPCCIGALILQIYLHLQWQRMLYGAGLEALHCQACSSSMKKLKECPLRRWLGVDKHCRCAKPAQRYRGGRQTGLEQAGA